MDDLIFLAHRLPFPPDKGDKIRSWRMLSHLAERFRVHLGAFVDDKRDAAHVGELRRICASLYCPPLNPVLVRLKSAAALFTGQSLTERYFHDRRMARWVAATMVRARPRFAFVYCSAMAPYLMPYRFTGGIVDSTDAAGTPATLTGGTYTVGTDGRGTAAVVTSGSGVLAGRGALAGTAAIVTSASGTLSGAAPDPAEAGRTTLGAMVEKAAEAPVKTRAKDGKDAKVANAGGRKPASKAQIPAAPGTVKGVRNLLMVAAAAVVIALLLALLKIGMPEVGGRQADGGGDDGPRAPVEVLGPDEV